LPAFSTRRRRFSDRQCARIAIAAIAPMPRRPRRCGWSGSCSSPQRLQDVRTRSPPSSCGPLKQIQPRRHGNTKISLVSFSRAQVSRPASWRRSSDLPVINGQSRLRHASGSFVTRSVTTKAVPSTTIPDFRRQCDLLLHGSKAQADHPDLVAFDSPTSASEDVPSEFATVEHVTNAQPRQRGRRGAG
jgi:hypothetical protein